MDLNQPRLKILLIILLVILIAVFVMTLYAINKKMKSVDQVSSPPASEEPNYNQNPDDILNPEPMPELDTGVSHEEPNYNLNPDDIINPEIPANL